MDNKDTQKAIGGFCFSEAPSLEQIRHRQAKFAEDRNWNKFHSPRNLLLAMVGEVGELAEIFQWKSDVKEGIPDWQDKDRQHLGEELSDVLIYLVRFSHICKIDLPAAVSKKFLVSSSLNGKMHNCVEKLSTSEVQIEEKDEKLDDGRNKHIIQIVTQPAEAVFSFSNGPTLEDIRRFTGKSNYHQLHSPRNLMFSLVSKVGEVTEIFQWKGEVEQGLLHWLDNERQHLADGLVDILINLIRLADKCNVDFPSVVWKKFEANERKYPPCIVYGSSRKYTEYEEVNGKLTLENCA